MARVAIATRTELDAPTIKVYEENVDGYPIGIVVAVLRKLETVGSNGFFPRLPDLKVALRDELERQDVDRIYVPLAERPAPCPTCDGTRFVEAPPQLVEEGQKPRRWMVHCPTCVQPKGKK